MRIPHDSAHPSIGCFQKQQQLVGVRIIIAPFSFHSCQNEGRLRLFFTFFSLTSLSPVIRLYFLGFFSLQRCVVSKQRVATCISNALYNTLFYTRLKMLCSITEEMVYSNRDHRNIRIPTLCFSIFNILTKNAFGFEYFAYVCFRYFFHHCLCQII